MVTADSLTAGSNLDPVPGLSVKTIYMSVELEDQPERMRYYALKSTDDAGLSASVSNVAQVLIALFIFE